MKIALSANSSWYIYNFRRNLLKSLINQGHTVSVVAPWDSFSEKIEALGIEFHSLPLKPRGLSPFFELWTLLALARILNEIKSDYVFTFTIKSNLYTGLVSYLLNFKLIANVSGLGEAFDKQGLLNKIVRALYRLSLRKAATIFFQNKEDYSYCASEGLVDPLKCKIIPGSGVDLQAFTPAKINSRINFSQRKKVFLMLGRLVPQKGYHLFIEASEIIKQRQPQNELYLKSEFWILGIPDSRKESQELFTRIKIAEKKGLVNYLEPTADVVPIIQQADVIVLPTLYNEGIPKILLESLACAKPAITTNWRGCKDAIVDGSNGFLIDPKKLSAIELANYIEHFLLMSEADYQLMSEKSRFLAETKFDERIVIDSYQKEVVG